MAPRPRAKPGVASRALFARGSSPATHKSIHPFPHPVSYTHLVGLCCLAAAGLSADYGAMGVLLVALFYLTRQRPAARAAMGSAALLSLGASELPALFSFLPISLYSGQKGRGPKWFFYWFYPLHLLLLWGVGRLFALSLNG